MDTIFVTLACFLLTLSCVSAQTEIGNLSTEATVTGSPYSSTTHTTLFSTVSEDTPGSDQTFTKSTLATTESTSPLLTSQSSASTISLTTSAKVTTAKPDTSTFSELTTAATHTAAGDISTSDTTGNTANSTHTVNTTSHSPDRTTKDSRLNNSEKNITILFSVILGVVAMTLSVFTFCKCRHRIQYLHQPLNNSEDMHVFEPDDDTLIISGGLYDGHPIYDNVPTASEDQSQFRLDFLC